LLPGTPFLANFLIAVGLGLARRPCLNRVMCPATLIEPAMPHRIPFVARLRPPKPQRNSEGAATAARCQTTKQPVKPVAPETTISRDFTKTDREPVRGKSREKHPT